MSSFNYQNSTITKYRAGTSSDPYIDITESKKVINGVIQLNEIPVSLNKVRITGYYELPVSNTTNLATNEYRVDYAEGLVYFNSAAEGLTLTAIYKGRGNHYVSSGRIWVEESEGNVVQTLKDIIVAGQEVIDELPTLNQTIDDAHEATTDANAAAANADTKAALAVTATTNANTATSNANTATGLANTATSQANTARDSANTAASAANTAKTNADTATSLANTAASNADDSADNADLKAAYALEQGDYAKAKGDYAAELSNKGEYDNGVTYKPLNIVVYNDAVYQNILQSTGVLPTNTTYWKMIMQLSVSTTWNSVINKVDASITEKGIVQLIDNASTPSTTLAPTANALKVVNDTLTAQLADVVQNHVYVRDNMTMAEIQALANSLVNGGVLDFVASANYHITSPISINYENIIVEGNGSTISVTSDIEVFSINNSSNTTVENFKIIDTTLTSRSKYHIHFHNCSKCLVQNVEIIGMTLTKTDVAGIWFSRATGLSSFVNRVQFCLLNQASIVMESTDSWTNNNTVWAYSRSFGIHAVKPSQFIEQNQIIGSSINGGVWVEDTIDGFNVELIKIQNNYFDGSYDAIDSGIGIKAVKMVDSIVAVNDFWRQMDESIIMTDCSTVKILGNTFKNGNRRDASKDDIVINIGGYNIIDANTFTRQVVHTNKGKCITGTGQNNVVSNNTVYFSTYYNTPRIDLHSSNKLWNNPGSGVADTKKSVSKMSLNYWLDNVPASSAAIPMNTGGGTQAYILGYAAKIVGLSVYSNEQHTAGTLTLTIYKNGVSTGETLTFNTNVFVVTKTVTTPIDVSPTETLTLRYATTGWAPTTADISASILIEFAE
jgi:hypothetical protein